MLFSKKEVQELFSIGDKIIFGSDGVYTVSEYTTSPIDKHDTRQFYLLRPVYGHESNIIITPASNERGKLRAVMSRDDALAFIDSMPEIAILTVEREKNRRDTYRQALDVPTPTNLVSIIKTVAVRREELAKVKKRPSESDNDYEKKAKHCLYGELSIALEIPITEVERFIECRLESVAI